MDEKIHNAIARIEVVHDEKVVNRGTGCLVGKNLVLTALHVVAERGIVPPDFYPGKIWLTFPNISFSRIRATVLDKKWDGREDWVLLDCNPHPAIDALPLATVERDGDEWESYGFPAAKPDGMFVGGKVRHRDGHVEREPAYQLYSDEAAAGNGMPIAGLSGAPVVVGGAVVGILRWSPSTYTMELVPTDDGSGPADGVFLTERATRTNVGGTIYACPSSVIAARCRNDHYFPETLKSVSSSSPAAPPPPDAAPATPAPVAANWKWWLAAAATLFGALLVGYTISRPPQGAENANGPAVTDKKLSNGSAEVGTSPISTAPTPDMNQEIVIDTSEGMKTPFDTAPTKLQAVIDALGGGLLHDRENLALRQFGGQCPSESRLPVDFGTKRGPHIVNAARSLTPRGQATLLSGVIDAIEDVKDLPHARRVTVLTGHADGCGFTEEYVFQEIRRFKESKKVDLEMRFIGLGVPADQEARLKRLGDHVGAQVFFAHTVAELRYLFGQSIQGQVVKIEAARTPGDVRKLRPVDGVWELKQVASVWEIVNALRAPLNEIINKNLPERDYDKAQRNLDVARNLHGKLQHVFSNVAGSPLSADFQRFYQLAMSNWLLHKEALEVLGPDLIRYGKASGDDPSAEYLAADKKLEENAGKYNNNLTEMDRLTNQMRSKTAEQP